MNLKKYYSNKNAAVNILIKQQHFIIQRLFKIYDKL
jgi:hypothetical protein